MTTPGGRGGILTRVAVLAAVAAAIVGGLSFSSSSSSAADETFLFRIFEGQQNHEEGIDPYFRFEIETTEQKPCFNWGIETNWSLSGTLLTVTLGAIIEPELCLTAFGPAKSHFKPDLAEGSYTLTIASGVRTDTYQVTVSSTSIEITPPGGSFTTPEFTRFYRPPHNSFGYYCGTVFTDEYFCDLFADEIERTGAQRFEFPGDGKAPFQGTPNGSYYNMTPRFYRYFGPEAWKGITAAHRAFVLQTLGDRCGAGIWLQNWRNEQARSWLIIPARCDDNSPAPTATPAPAVLPGTGAEPVQRTYPPAISAIVGAAFLTIASALAISAARRR